VIRAHIGGMIKCICVLRLGRKMFLCRDDKSTGSSAYGRSVRMKIGASMSYKHSIKKSLFI
jgi:hypothetical protein